MMLLHNVYFVLKKRFSRFFDDIAIVFQTTPEYELGVNMKKKGKKRQESYTWYEAW